MTAAAADPTLIESVAARVDRQRDLMVDVRRDLHRNPEVSRAEVRTSAVVAEVARSLGLTTLPCPTPTGGVYELAGGRPGRTVLLRADIDALPVEEASADLAASAVPGAMHACGHDLHAAWLLGAAGALADRAEDLAGRIVFLFQPAEEEVSGARAMVEAGLLEDLGVDVVVGAHVTSLGPLGSVTTRGGTLMAGCDVLRIEVQGSGGHGGLDPVQGNVVLAAARIVDLLSTAVAGLASEGSDCVCSAGLLQAGTAANIIPGRAVVLGTLRTYSAEHRAEALARLDLLVAAVAGDLGVEVTLERSSSTPPVQNAPSVARRSVDVARVAVPGARVAENPSPVSASDDIAELLARRPGCYLFVGGARPDGSSGHHHTAAFCVDEGALEVGARLLAGLAVDLAVPPAPGGR